MSDLIKNDPLVGSNFWLQFDGEDGLFITEVSGLDVEIEVVEAKQTSKNGIYATYKGMGQAKMAAELTIKRLAPLEAEQDFLWKWFKDIRDKGMHVGDRSTARKNGSLVIYDASNTEVARWNFFNGWPSKISSDSFSAGSAEPISETVTLVIEKLDRKK